MLINMPLNQNDLAKIGQIIDKSLDNKLQSYPTKDDLKKAIDPIESDVKTLKTDVSGLKTDVSAIKESLNNLLDLSTRAFGELLPWTDGIHKVIVRDKLPKRVKDLESIHPKGTHSPS